MPKVVPRQLGVRATIKKHEYTNDDDGTTARATAVVGIRHCTITPLSSKELYEAKQVKAEGTHRIRLRYDSVTSTVDGVSSWLEPAIGSRVFEIVGSLRNEHERNMYLIGECKVREGA